MAFLGEVGETIGNFFNSSGGLTMDGIRGSVADTWGTATGVDLRENFRQDRSDARGYTAGQVARADQGTQYALDQDAWRKGLATDQFDWQRGIAELEDARRFGLYQDNIANQNAAFDEALTNAGLYYDETTGNALDAYGNVVGNANDLYAELTGNADQYGGMATSNAQGYQGDIVGNADRMYDELTDNARYSDADYQQASDLASANVLQSFDKARGSARRNMLRYGGDPNSSDFARFENQSALDQALAESGAVNTSRRAMKSEERGRLNSAIMAGLTARANALQSGYGATDSATRYAGESRGNAITTGRKMINDAELAGRGMVSSAYGSGRSAMDTAQARGRAGISDAYKTGIDTKSSQYGMVDPRLDLKLEGSGAYDAAANQYGNAAGTTSARATKEADQGYDQVNTFAKTVSGIFGGM